MCALYEPFRAAAGSSGLSHHFNQRLVVLHPGSRNGYNTPLPLRVAWTLTLVLATKVPAYPLVEALERRATGDLP